MADLIPYRPLLEVYFDNEQPITAADLSALLTPMAKDFHRFRRGSELVVVSVESGSLRLKLGSVTTAFAMVAGGISHANDVIDFGKHVGEIISWSAENHAPPKKRVVGVSSAKAILDTAVSAKARFRLNYKGPDGEQLFVEMDAPAAVVARAAMHPPEQAKALAEHSIKALPHTRSRLAKASESALSPLPDTALDRLIAYRDTLPEGTSVSNDEGFRAAIRLFVETMEASGNTYGLNDVEAKLKAKGLYEIAAMVREARRDTGRNLRLTQGP